MERFDVIKKADGLMVVERDTRETDYLSPFEGLLWRLFRHLPKRVTSWPTEGILEARRAIREAFRSPPAPQKE